MTKKKLCLNALDPGAKLHFSGVGGIGISGLAEIVRGLGYTVQGTDLLSNYNTKRLADKGIKIFNDHSKSDLDGVSFLIRSTSIADDNPEIKRCREKNIPIVERHELLAELMQSKVSIAVSGSHGKTTTTSLVASVLEAAGLEPTVIIGGIIDKKKTNAYIGKSNVIVVEADESDGTFIKIPSVIAVVTNIDREHLDYYGTYEDLKKAFYKFLSEIPFYGFGVVCADNKDLRELAAQVKDKEILTYSISDKRADAYVDNIRSGVDHNVFDICFSERLRGITLHDVKLSVPGLHNMQNSLAAAVVAVRMKLDPEYIKKAFEDFGNVKRRFTLTKEIKGIKFIDDYAHHPREIQATLSTAKQVVSKSKGRIFVVFQPHRYTRTQELFNEFVNCFGDADTLYIADIYPASEKPIPKINKEILVGSIRKNYSDKKVYVLNSWEDLPDIIKNECKKNDIVLFLGAGDITQWAYSVPDRV